MEVLSNPTVIAGLTSLLVILALYMVFVPRNTEYFAPNISDKAEGAAILKVLASLGGGVYSALPDGVNIVPKNRLHKTDSLLTRSGNPWGITAREFIIFQFTMSILGAVLGAVMWALVGDSLGYDIPVFVYVLLFAFAGFVFPWARHSDLARRRDVEFRQTLPEALELIIISLAGGATFARALKEAIPNMPDSILKNEFREIDAQINAGRTVNDALDHFGSRAPNESIRTFVQAVRQANELNSPLGEVLKARAQASRDDFFALLQEKTAALPSRMTIVMIPTIVPGFVIVAVGPSILAMMDMIG